MILLTRPEGASARTKIRLEAEGHKVLADPLLALRFSPPERLFDKLPDALVITSSNGARAIADHHDIKALLPVPVWTVGGRTSAAVRELGFSVAFEALDVVHLAEGLGDRMPMDVLYLAAENRTGELAELVPRHRVETLVVYSAVAATELNKSTLEALRAGRIAHLLHYSTRLAETYLKLAESADLLREALAPIQLCLSEQVAAPVREAGAQNIRVAEEPREDALIGLLG